MGNNMDEIYFTVEEAEAVIQRAIDKYEDPWVVWELSYTPGSAAKYHLKFVMPTVLHRDGGIPLRLIHGQSMREVLNQAAQWVAGNGIAKAVRDWEIRAGKSVSSVLPSVKGA